jgi:hypothetical protein
VPKGSKDLEAFLLVVQKERIDCIVHKGNIYKPNLKSENLKNACNKNLQDAKMVTIPMDKTNYFKCIGIRDYKEWAIKHLLKSGKEIPRSKQVQVLSIEVNKILESLEDVMSEDEHYFVKESQTQFHLQNY